MTNQLTVTNENEIKQNSIDKKCKDKTNEGANKHSTEQNIAEKDKNTIEKDEHKIKNKKEQEHNSTEKINDEDNVKNITDIDDKSDDEGDKIVITYEEYLKALEIDSSLMGQDKQEQLEKLKLKYGINKKVKNTKRT
ncbi:putative uncharacterized protein DDB_G0274405 [Centruroides vittatus]|uniref:putative uncharacterized protein DDB_G0274405 n=1 Tax=Centruroides vittatus TaxID=120091 RepID=UPI00350F4905